MEFRESLVMHLNGGKKFSKMVRKVTGDGVDYGITHVTETSGSPKYIKTVDVFVKGEEFFDNLKNKSVGLIDCLTKHSV